jgi:hypothetical protein
MAKKITPDGFRLCKHPCKRGEPQLYFMASVIGGEGFVISTEPPSPLPIAELKTAIDQWLILHPQVDFKGIKIDASDAADHARQIVRAVALTGQEKTRETRRASRPVTATVSRSPGHETRRRPSTAVSWFSTTRTMVAFTDLATHSSTRPASTASNNS